jgi:hypothetical protein
MVADIRRVLSSDGLYMVNVIDFGPLGFVRAETRTIADEFPYVAVIGTPDAIAGRTGGNFVLVAADRPLPTAAIQDRLGTRATLLADPAGVRAFVGDAPLLTDDYAPVDQLLTPYLS